MFWIYNPFKFDKLIIKTSVIKVYKKIFYCMKLTKYLFVNN
ncbi:MAG: hypothetical protein BWX49_02128 [Bacteroidetes bacterium ADurb.Bin008]|mgnify:CR=1 FL=1|jgi:hypothetical protein|nr:MAG: hypothetical protein BWX49_02128 [Bacteroidetes bacterium ADurb.Bin008]